MTPISVPDSVSILDVPETVLAVGWNQPIPLPITQEYGGVWAARGSSAVLRVPSAIVRLEWNYVLNVRHREFPRITFGPAEPFTFDLRLKS
jgi:RES domain-containing protein